MTEAGHSFAHFPQPTHRSALTAARIPCQIWMADRGHTFTQQPQATQVFLSTTALRFFLVVIPYLPNLMKELYQDGAMSTVINSHKGENHLLARLVLKFELLVGK